MFSLHDLLAEIGSILHIFQLYIFLQNKKPSHSLASEKNFCKFFKIMRRFGFNRYVKD